MTVTTNSREETQALAARIAAGLDLIDRSSATILTLRGDLGAGKTTFTQGLLKELGVADSVTSPTFVLVQRYPLASRGFTNAYHVDAYRLGDATELDSLGLTEPLADPSALIIVEWPEIGGELFKPTLDIALAHGSHPEERHITVNPRV